MLEPPELVPKHPTHKTARGGTCVSTLVVHVVVIQATTCR